MSLIDRLIEFHRREYWSQQLSDSEARAYYRTALDKGRIILYVEDGLCQGYLESFRLDFERLGRLLCNQRFNIALEDINTGPICYVNSIYLEPEVRMRWSLSYFKHRLFLENPDAEIFIGERAGRNGSLRIYNRAAFMNKEVEIYGKK